MDVRKVILDRIPYSGTLDLDHPENGSGTWPANWICGEFVPPFVAAFRLFFSIATQQVIRIHVSADERYELFLDGLRIGLGPERGEPRHWHFESYDLDLDAGRHSLVARVWALGSLAPFAQFSLMPGFFLCPDDPDHAALLSTGQAGWEVKWLDGYTFTSPSTLFGTGYRVVIDGKTYPWSVERGEGRNWQAVRVLHPGYNAEMRSETLPTEHLLLPGFLPAMMNKVTSSGRIRHISSPALAHVHSIPIRATDHIPAEVPAWTALLQDAVPLIVPAHTRRRVLIDLDNYLCAYPELVTSGGKSAKVRIGWVESLYADLETWSKGRRGEIEEKYVVTAPTNEDAIADVFLPDGGPQRMFSTLWWSAGRFVEILLETDNQPLTIERLAFRETRYPLENQSNFHASDTRLEQAGRIAFRGLQMCAHETYIDCPYYEQLMYVGDTRLEALVSYLTSSDDRLPRKALKLFDFSRLTSGLTQSRFPSRMRQMIPPFSLWWVGMVYDFMLWRDDLEFVRSLMPGVRAVLDYFAALSNADGLIQSPVGWNFMDWVPEWQGGVAPGGKCGEVCTILNWLYVYAQMKAAEVEDALNELEMAARCRRRAGETCTALDNFYWNPKRGLYADDLQHTIFSEHSQCLAILSKALTKPRQIEIGHSLFTESGLVKTTVYFMHYYFETCRELGRMDIFIQRMQPWFEMAEYDFKTPYESGTPENVRSDCHGWGAHPLYHYYASLLGIHPLGAGFHKVEIQPQLAGLSSLQATVIHPAGEIVVKFCSSGKSLSGYVSLPKGIVGELVYAGNSINLLEGLNSIKILQSPPTEQ